MDNRYVILLENGKLVYKFGVNAHGLTIEEVSNYIQENNLLNAVVVDMIVDLSEMGIDINNAYRLSRDAALFQTWYNAFVNSTCINGFNMPQYANSNNDYRYRLREILNQYIKSISTIGFKHELNLVNDVKRICDDIITALDFEIQNNNNDREYESQNLSEKILGNIINEYINDPFWVSELDKSYAFRGIAPLIQLHTQGNEAQYIEMLKDDLSFYRARKIPKNNKPPQKIAEMFHLPYNQKKSASTARFSISGQPCLYLGTTSFICCEELEYNENDTDNDIYISSFRFNEKGKRMKILNLAVSVPLINGIYRRSSGDENRHQILLSMLRIFPLVIATSFHVAHSNVNESKYEYFISQVLMKIINQHGISGIAYLSKKGKNDFQYPHGVNLALPSVNIRMDQPYGELCKCMFISNPIAFSKCDYNENLCKSYINKKYPRYRKGEFENFTSKIYYSGQYVFYDDTKYSKIDDFLVSQQHICLKPDSPDAI